MTYPPLSTPWYPSQLRTVFLGTPGHMEDTAVPDVGVTFPFSRSGSSTSLISGGTSISRRLRTRRVYGLNYSERTPDELDTIFGFYSGLRGDGPFCLIDPAQRNYLGQAVSTFGRQLQAISGWSTPASSRPVAYDGTMAPAYGVVGGNCGVARWTHPVIGDEVFEGSFDVVGTTIIPDSDSLTRAGTAVPYLPGQVHTVSMAAAAVTGVSSVQLVAYGLKTAGGLVGASPNVASAVIPLTTAWSWITVPVPVNSFSSDTEYVCISVRCTSSTGHDIRLSNPMHQIGVDLRAPWVAGLGVPRVNVLDPNAAGATVWARQTQTLQLAEI